MKNVDFLPQRYVDRLVMRQYSRRNLLWAVAVFGALGLLYAANASRIRSASAMLSGFQEEQVLQQRTRARLHALRGRKIELQREFGLISSLDDHAPADLVLTELSGFLSDSMAIRSLELDRINEQAERFPAPAGGEAAKNTNTVSRVRLEGVAPSDVEIGIFYGRLSSSPLFDEVELHFTRGGVEADREVRLFEVSFQVVPISVAPDPSEGNDRG